MDPVSTGGSYFPLDWPREPILPPSQTLPPPILTSQGAAPLPPPVRQEMPSYRQKIQRVSQILGNLPLVLPVSLATSPEALTRMQVLPAPDGLRTTGSPVVHNGPF